MNQYRTLPHVIEAVQFADDTERLLEIKKFMSDARITISYADKDNPTLKIEDRDGIMEASIGNYIVKGVDGEFYLWEQDIFEKMHEKVN